MKKNQVEQSVKRAFVNAAPYQLDKVTEKCKEQKGKVIPLENKQVKKSMWVRRAVTYESPDAPRLLRRWCC